MLPWCLCDVRALLPKMLFLLRLHHGWDSSGHVARAPVLYYPVLYKHIHTGLQCCVLTLETKTGLTTNRNYKIIPGRRRKSEVQKQPNSLHKTNTNKFTWLTCMSSITSFVIFQAICCLQGFFHLSSQGKGVFPCLCRHRLASLGKFFNIFKK